MLSKKGNENLESIKKSETLSALWDRYQQKNTYAASANWSDVLVSVEELYKITEKR